MKEYREESVYVLGIFDLSSKGSDSGSFMKDVSENTAIEIKPTTTDGTRGDDIKYLFTTLSLRSPSVQTVSSYPSGQHRLLQSKSTLSEKHDEQRSLKHQRAESK
jgi:hypothetical protein